MRLALAFIYYFVIFMVGLTVLLAFLCIKKLRHLTFNILNKLKIRQFPITRMILWIVILIVTILLIDSVLTYREVSKTLQNLEGHKVDLFQSIKSHEVQQYLGTYKKLREFYMAQRNFMLSASALLIVFIYSRFLATFRKLFEMEQEYQGKVKAV